MVGLSILSGAHMTLVPRITALLRRARHGRRAGHRSAGSSPMTTSRPCGTPVSPRSSAQGPRSRRSPTTCGRTRDRATSRDGRFGVAGGRACGCRRRGRPPGPRPVADRGREPHRGRGGGPARLYPLAGQAHLVGITGPPGSGKSTLVAALIAEVRRAGRTVAVIAVDPSSPITGGALLGDRVRMQSYAEDGDVFIRSMASRGHAGGLASTSTAAAAVLDAAGFDLILDRDRRDRPERGRGRRRRRHDGRARGARDGRRGPGDQGGAPRGGRPGRRQQGRQAGRAADGGPVAGDAGCRRATTIGYGRS